MTDREHLARALWTLFEPLHAVSYFATESREAFAAVGLTRFWDGYFAGRSAPLGAVGAAPVTAIFSGFAPVLASRALPAVWDVASPSVVLEARLSGATAFLRTVLLDEAAVGAAADALTSAAAAADTIARPLAAANQALPVSPDPYRRLWQAAATLREHRGDGHVIALATLGIAGLSTIVLRSGLDLAAGAMQKARGWTDEQWAAEASTLIARGLLDDSGRATDSGRSLLDEAERMTNRLAVSPWAALADAEILSVARLLHPLAQGVGALFPHPNPIGMPPPWDPVTDPSASAIAVTPVG